VPLENFNGGGRQQKWVSELSDQQVCGDSNFTISKLVTTPAKAQPTAQSPLVRPPIIAHQKYTPMSLFSILTSRTQAFDT